jgi:hypothetical protein
LTSSIRRYSHVSIQRRHRFGGQTLFSKLREYVDDPGALTREFEAYEALRADRSLREETLAGGTIRAATFVSEPAGPML